MRENPLKVQLETGETHLSEQELQEAHEAALLCHHVYDETARNTEELEKLCKVSDLRFGGGNTKYLTCMRGETMYVAYRGTTQNIDWLTNLNAAEAFIEDVPVHKGFLSRLDLVWEPIKNAVIGKKRLVFTGHSLGGALAMLSYVRLVKGKDATAELKANVNCFTFGAPLVLRTAAPNATSGVDSTKIHNFVHHYDIVPRILAKIPTRVLVRVLCSSSLADSEMPARARVGRTGKRPKCVEIHQGCHLRYVRVVLLHSSLRGRSPWPQSAFARRERHDSVTDCTYADHAHLIPVGPTPRGHHKLQARAAHRRSFDCALRNDTPCPHPGPSEGRAGQSRPVRPE